jgi:hypothetical protein
MDKKSILQQQVDVVLAQLKAASPTLKFYVGDESNGEKKLFTKTELIQHVTLLDDIGKEFLETQVAFMTALQNGDFQKVLMA